MTFDCVRKPSPSPGVKPSSSSSASSSRRVPHSAVAVTSVGAAVSPPPPLHPLISFSAAAVEGATIEVPVSPCAPRTSPPRCSSCCCSAQLLWPVSPLFSVLRLKIRVQIVVIIHAQCESENQRFILPWGSNFRFYLKGDPDFRFYLKGDSDFQS